MKKSFVLICLLFTLHGFTQKTKQYQGQYSYGDDIEKGRIGNIIIYPETDSTFLFYLDANRGAPSYNMGLLYGSVTLKENTGIYSMNFANEKRGCKLSFQFSKNKLTIATIDTENHCLMGKGVYADGAFKRKNNQLIEYFTDPEGRKTYFKKIKPKDYYKD